MSSTKVCTSVKWAQMCSLFDKIRVARRSMKKEVLTNFMESYRLMLQKQKREFPDIEDSFFPVLRILLPALDKERGAYGVKEKKLADLYIKILTIKKDSPDAVKLLNYRRPKTAGGSAVGDFAEVAYYVLKNRCPTDGSLTLEEVDNYLSSIAEDHAAKSNDAVTNTMSDLLRKMSAQEQKWLIRVLLKDMHLGLGQSAIFAAWHPDAKDFYDVNNNLRKVCTTLRDPLVRLHEIEVSLFSPFRPMLAERALLEKVEAQMKNKTYIVEDKFDGERSQLHKKGTQYMYFSRNGFDFTANFGRDCSSGSLTPHLSPLFGAHVKEVILDGEVVCWHKEHSVIIPKGEHYDVKNLHEDGPVQVCFCAFDILHLNGRTLTNLPLRERKNILKSVLKEQKGRVILSKFTEAHNKSDVIEALNDAIDRREEGLVIKDPDSVYKPAARTAGWIKVKPDYVESLVPDMDLVIIGGFYGKGSQHGVVSHFLLGAADSESITDGNRITKVVSVCRVGSGYTSEQLSDLGNKLSGCTVGKRPNNVVECLKDKPAVWYDPSKSVVIQVRAAEVSNTKSYGAKYTLRFPRVEMIRDDKSWQDIMTTDELHKLRAEGGGKLALNHYQSEEDKSLGPSPKKGAVARYFSTVTGLASHNKPADLSGVKQTDSFLKGKQICVLESGGSMNKQELEKMVASCGGSLIQNPNEKTYCILTNKLTVRSNNYRNKFNIIKPDWLLTCNKKRKLLPWGPLDVVLLLPDDVSKCDMYYDQFGDSYTETVDQEDLKRILDQMEYVDHSSEDIKNLMTDLSEFDEPYNLFSRIVAVVLDETGEPLENSLAEQEILLYGGKVVHSFSDEVTHVIDDSNGKSRNGNYGEKVQIVTSKWIDDMVGTN